MLKVKDSDGLPGLEVLQRFDEQLDCLLKAEINGLSPGLRDILKDYSVQINDLLAANDDESLPRLRGILRHHSLKLEGLGKRYFELNLTAFHLNLVECQKVGVTQSEVGSRLQYYEDGTFTTKSLSYVSVWANECSVQETFNIYEKYQSEATEKIKELLVQRAKTKYDRMFEATEERVAREEAEMGCTMEEHHARIKDLDEYLYNRMNN
jgi:hypothetical protein